jgi:hypothetical protein
MKIRTLKTIDKFIKAISSEEVTRNKELRKKVSFLQKYLSCERLCLTPVKIKSNKQIEQFIAKEL